MKSTQYLNKLARNLITLLLLSFSLAAFSQELNERHNYSNDTFPNPVNQLTGVGYGASPQLAKANALAHLTQQINQLISYNRCQLSFKKDASSCFSSSYHLNFKLSGLIYTKLDTAPGEFGQKIMLSQGAVEQSYLETYKRLVEEVKSTLELPFTQVDLDSTKTLWRDKQQLEAYAGLLKLFGIILSQELSTNEIQQITHLQIEWANTLQTLEELPSNLIKLGPIENAFIHAPIPLNEIEMTPFSKHIRTLIYKGLVKRFPNQEIQVRGLVAKGLKRERACYDPMRSIEIKCQNRISIIKNEAKSDSNMLLLGDYRKLDENTLLLYYELFDTEQGLLNFNFFKVPSNLASQYRYKTLNHQFDQALHQTILPDDQFQTELSSSRGKRNILLSEGDDFGLKLRLSQPGYFYLVGHVVQEEHQFSYLVELDPSTELFVGYIGESRINRWLDIGEFTIEPPFGVEHLQLISANYDLNAYLPPTQWNDKLGYHVIKNSQDNALAGLTTVRGLQRVCSHGATRGLQRTCSSKAVISKTPEQDPTEQSQSNKTAHEHESVLSYTSLPLDR